MRNHSRWRIRDKDYYYFRSSIFRHSVLENIYLSKLAIIVVDDVPSVSSRKATLILADQSRLTLLNFHRHFASHGEITLDLPRSPRFVHDTRVYQFSAS